MFPGQPPHRQNFHDNLLEAHKISITIGGNNHIFVLNNQFRFPFIENILQLKFVFQGIVVNPLHKSWSQYAVHGARRLNNFLTLFLINGFYHLKDPSLFYVNPS
jgi:hypothetical protein